ncbi:helix-turn-helix transcriptional regulator [Plantactinospora sp. KBS50]|uniref:helix-turn-helix domain-containing protein n=1 Tax=Plantactinospora sp. KBS50 TaxID=2024580 RepID=UPI000BAAD67C|nr:helix-turn-helix transcriptional regulator [Plantactinospora sp. KBS50]ASW54890.1 transcriptional regulator [Plantactinospora sp. KBS50]
MATDQAGNGSATGPTVLRMLLGSQLRRLREGRGVTRESAGYEIRASEPKISRMELGRVGFKERDVADLLTLYGVTDDGERESLLGLARQANTPGWWHRYGDVLPNWFQAYLGLEAAASLIRTYEVQFVPGLLQTRDYARAVILLGHDRADASEIETRVDLRMARQRIMSRSDAPRLWAVIDEAALRRPIGGVEVMRSQLTALIEATKLPNVRLQIMPFAAGGHSAAGGNFSILRFPDADLPDVVYIEQLTSALYLDKRDDIDHYAAAIERVCVEAEPPERTTEILEGVLRDYDRVSG